MRYHVFIKPGDAIEEVEGLLREMGGSPAAAGLHKHLYVAQARQTVVMLADGDVPLAGALRGRQGWTEPAAGADG